MDILASAKLILLDFDGTISAGPAGGYMPVIELKERFKLSDQKILKLNEFESNNWRKYFRFNSKNPVDTLEKEARIMRSFYSDMADFASVDLEKDSFVEFWVSRRRNSVFELYPDVEPFIARIKGKCSIGILTDGMPSREKEVERLPCFKDLDFVFVSNSLGFGKKQNEMYQYIIKTSGFKAFEILLIDDSPDFLSCAKANGFKVLLIDRNAKRRRELGDFANLDGCETVDSFEDIVF
jgi:HAD superfamily hydrolase (TIGR01509 family)